MPETEGALEYLLSEGEEHVSGLAETSRGTEVLLAGGGGGGRGCVQMRWDTPHPESGAGWVLGRRP